MNWIDFLDKNSSAIFGLIGTIVGFAGNYFLQKRNHKFEVIKDESKRYFKQKRNVLNNSLKLFTEYETKIETLHDFIEDEYGVPIGIVKKEDIFAKYFKHIYEYLDSNRIFLDEKTIQKLNNLTQHYYNYILATKVIISEYNDEDIAASIGTENEKLFKMARFHFNQLIEEIKYVEIKNFKEKMEQQ